jgi:hypothetical protein
MAGAAGLEARLNRSFDLDPGLDAENESRFEFSPPGRYLNRCRIWVKKIPDQLAAGGRSSFGEFGAPAQRARCHRAAELGVER